MPRTLSLEEEFFQRTEGITPVVRNLVLDKFFCFTGRLDSMGRSLARQKVEQGGGHWTTSVNFQTEVLVAGSIPRTAIIAGAVSLKLQKARQRGIEIVSEETFLQMLEDAGVQV